MDNTVEKHIQVLSNSGVSDWGPHGKKFQEWTSRRRYVLCRFPVIIFLKRVSSSHWKQMVQEREGKAKMTAGSSRDIQATSSHSHDSVQQITPPQLTNEQRVRELAHNHSLEPPVVSTNQREPPRRRRHSRRSRYPQDHNNGTGHDDNTANPRRRSRRR